jgi:hypothetical protein
VFNIYDDFITGLFGDSKLESENRQTISMVNFCYWFDLFFTTAVSFCDRLGQMDFNAHHVVRADAFIGIARQVRAKPNAARAREQHYKSNKLVVCSRVFSIVYLELQS